MVGKGEGFIVVTLVTGSRHLRKRLSMMKPLKRVM